MYAAFIVDFRLLAIMRTSKIKRRRKVYTQRRLAKPYFRLYDFAREELLSGPVLAVGPMSLNLIFLVTACHVFHDGDKAVKE